MKAVESAEAVEAVESAEAPVPKKRAKRGEE